MTKTRGILLAAFCGLAGIGWAEAPVRAEVPGKTTGQLEATAPSSIDRLVEATSLGALMQVVATEGARHGLGLESALFPGKGGRAWATAVSLIQAPERLAPIVADTLAQELMPEDAEDAAAFFSSDLGRRIVEREVSARRAMLDASVEAEAKASVADGHERSGLISELIEALDLVTANVSGGLNANYAFYRGLAEGGAMARRLTEGEMLAMVREQESEIRAATRAWLEAYMTLAYEPLSDDDLRGYIAFSRTQAGRRYNAAMFRGFGAVFEGTSYDLGRAAARFIVQEDA